MGTSEGKFFGHLKHEGLFIKPNIKYASITIEMCAIGRSVARNSEGR